MTNENHQRPHSEELIFCPLTMEAPKYGIEMLIIQLQQSVRGVYQQQQLWQESDIQICDDLKDSKYGTWELKKAAKRL
jgi:hypothetical protein